MKPKEYVTKYNLEGRSDKKFYNSIIPDLRKDFLDLLEHCVSINPKSFENQVRTLEQKIDSIFFSTKLTNDDLVKYKKYIFATVIRPIRDSYFINWKEAKFHHRYKTDKEFKRKYDTWKYFKEEQEFWEKYDAMCYSTSNRWKAEDYEEAFRKFFGKEFSTNNKTYENMYEFCQNCDSVPDNVKNAITILFTDTTPSIEITAKTINKAFKEHVVKCHPDIAGDTPENKSKTISLIDAKETLLSCLNGTL